MSEDLQTPSPLVGSAPPLTSLGERSGADGRGEGCGQKGRARQGRAPLIRPFGPPSPTRGEGLSRVTIIDLGYGNLGSIRTAFERLGVAAESTGDPRAIAAADRLVLPGVGSAPFAMERIRALGVADALCAFPRPLLGICLGMQLLFDWSEEGETSCLGLVCGNVRRLTPAPGRPVPHMGWSRLTMVDESFGLATGDYVYFAHSFACDPGPFGIAHADHGGPIPAIVARGNVLGCQFHPERSGATGARFLQAFLAS